MVYIEICNLGALISNRYIYYISYEDLAYKGKENEYLIWGASLDHPLDFSSYGIDTKKYVRAKIPICAWHLKAIDEKKTEAIYLIETSLEGSLP